MKKVTILLVVCFAVTLLLIGGTPKVASTADPTIVRIGTHPVGAFFNVVGNAMGKVINARTPMRAKVMPMSGPPAWMSMMAGGEIDLGVVAVADGYWGYLGKENYKGISKGKGFPLRLLLTGIYNDVSIITSKDSGIKIIRDLRGKKVAGG